MRGKYMGSVRGENQMLQSCGSYSVEAAAGLHTLLDPRLAALLTQNTSHTRPIIISLMNHLARGVEDTEMGLVRTSQVTPSAVVKEP